MLDGLVVNMSSLYNTCVILQDSNLVQTTIDDLEDFGKDRSMIQFDLSNLSNAIEDLVICLILSGYKTAAFDSRVEMLSHIHSIFAF